MAVDVSDLSENEVVTFSRSKVWKCILAEMEERLESTRTLMMLAPPEDIWGTDSSGKTILEKVGFKRLQGQAEELLHLISTPSDYIALIKAEKGEPENGQE